MLVKKKGKKKKDYTAEQALEQFFLVYQLYTKYRLDEYVF